MNRRLIYYYLGAIALVAAWYFVVRQPEAAEQKKLNDEIAAAESKLADYRTTVADLPTILEQQKQLLSSKSELESSLFAKRDILKLFRELNDHVDRHNLQITEISPPLSELVALNQKMQQPGEPLFLNIKLTIRGGYIEFGQYVAELEQQPYFRGINRCVVQSGQSSNDPTIFRIDFKALLGSTEQSS